MRLRSDIWIAAYLRRVMAAGGFVAVRTKGVPEGGAIFIRIDHLDGAGVLYGPAPQSVLDEDGAERRFRRMHTTPELDNAGIEARLKKETGFDPDLWIIEVEDRQKRNFLDDGTIVEDR